MQKTMIVELKQGSRDWLEYRKTKFNASETPDVLGIGFNKPYKLALIKSGDEIVYQNYAMKAGVGNEPAVREYINAKYGLNLKPVVMLSDDDERFSASLDGADFDKDIFCELKFTDKEFEYLLENGKPSEKYYYQIQHQFYVSGLSKCIFGVGRINLNFDREIISVEVQRDDEAIDKIKNAWGEFEKNHMHQKLDHEWGVILDELHNVNKEIQELDKRREKLKKRAIEKADGKEIKAYGVTIYKIERKANYDYKAYVKDNKIDIPEIYKKEATTSWGVRIED
nr:YqaJ viral recombinase family protein [Campylobacter fetus]